MSIETILKQNNIDDISCAKFKKYYDLLVEWNQKMNLTAITEEDDVAVKHFLDSLCADIPEIVFCGANVIDVGTGAGFPGIPVKIVRPDIHITLLDSLEKRINFLSEVVSSVELENVNCVHMRAEDGGRDKKYREKFDVCLSRAVANLSTLSELCLPFLKSGGYFISLKGPKASEEIESAKNAVKILGGEIIECRKCNISDYEYEHYAVIIKKISQTPTKYPRKAPKPSKEPLA